MIKPYHLIISALLGGLVVFILMCSTGKETGSTKQQTTELNKDRNKLVNETVIDSSLVRQVRVLRDSIVYHRKRSDYWRSRYNAPIEVTKQEEYKVFLEDSATITKEVIKGSLCDSLQRAQVLEIISLSEANQSLDSLVRIRAQSIGTFMKMDLIHFKIESELHKKIRNRTIGEVLLGIMAVLAIIFH